VFNRIRMYNPGDIFNPYKLFTGLIVPEALAKCPWISPAAKLIYGRLARYAGQDGNCHPAVATLAAEVGLKRRQVQTHLKALEKANLIKRIARRSKDQQLSNGYVFVWHPLFAPRVINPAPPGVRKPAPIPMQDPAHKESQTEESQTEEKLRDLDSLPRIAKTCDSRPHSKCAQYPLLRNALADYMITADDSERVKPSDRLVVDIMDSAGGASEQEVVQCLAYLKNDRGLRPGTNHGPRHFSWFKSVVGDYFYQKRSRETVYAYDSSKRTELSQDALDEMTEAIETN